MMKKSLSQFKKMRFGDPRLTVFCMAILSVGSSSLAADGVAPAAPSAAQANQDIEALLRKVERQISTNHTMSPAGDSAVDAWKQVLQVISITDPVRVSNALTIFVTHMQRRADEERRAGNIALAEDLSVFASQADGLTAPLRSQAPKADAGPRALDARLVRGLARSGHQGQSPQSTAGRLSADHNGRYWL